MTKYISRAAIAAAAVVLGVSGAYAGTAQSTLTVTANLGTSCSVAASTLSFGAITNVDTTDQTAQGALSVTCTNGLQFAVDLLGDSGNSSRTLTGANPGNAINYNIYQDSQYQTVWGSQVAGGIALTSQVGTGLAQSFPVYGKIPHTGSLPPADNYSEIVTIQVSY